MEFDGLGTPCLLYCGSCRYYMNEKCKGCETESRASCVIRRCCVNDRQLLFCTECDNFPCEALTKSVGVHPGWIKEQLSLRVKRWRS